MKSSKKHNGNWKLLPSSRYLVKQSRLTTYLIDWTPEEQATWKEGQSPQTKGPSTDQKSTSIIWILNAPSKACILKTPEWCCWQMIEYLGGNLTESLSHWGKCSLRGERGPHALSLPSLLLLGRIGSDLSPAMKSCPATDPKQWSQVMGNAF